MSQLITTTSEDNFETRIARLELAIFGNKELKMAGIQDKLDKLEVHAEEQAKHNAKQEQAASRQRWIAVGILAGLAANGITLATVMRLAATLMTGATP